MRRNLILFAMLSLLMAPLVDSKAESVETDYYDMEETVVMEEFEVMEVFIAGEEEITVRPTPRASRILVSSIYSLGKNTCQYSLSFLTASSGHVTASLQKKSGSSWVTVATGPKTSFTDIWDLDSGISVSNLSSGSYRFKIVMSVNGYNETKESGTYTL